MAFVFYVAVVVGFLILVTILQKYIKSRIAWCKSKTCLLGKTVIVTGANTGIGYETALDFAKRGARVILACRNREKAKIACSKIIGVTGNKNVIVKIIDMASFKSVRRFAEDIHKTEDRLDILVNNAGAGGIGDVRTEDGHVFIMQVNYLSHFLLTHLLIGLLKKSAPSRVINVSSIAAKYAKFDVNKLDEFPGKITVYSNSKLCNILFTTELSERLEGTAVTTYSLHPGAVKTEILREMKGLLRFVFSFIAYFFKTSEEGAQTTIHTAVTKGIEKYNGEHFEECRRVDQYLTAADPGLPKKLWELSETAVKLSSKEVLI